MKKLNWTALITYLFVVGISTFVGWWLCRIIYFLYLVLKALI